MEKDSMKLYELGLKLGELNAKYEIVKKLKGLLNIKEIIDITGLEYEIVEKLLQDKSIILDEIRIECNPYTYNPYTHDWRFYRPKWESITMPNNDDDYWKIRYSTNL